jgi:hypothetical protein
VDTNNRAKRLFYIDVPAQEIVVVRGLIDVYKEI